MTLQKSDHALSLVAACGCKTGGGMTLPKSAFKWRHEAANRHLLHRMMLGAKARARNGTTSTLGTRRARQLQCPC
jgi:hypothetical protein